MITLYTGTPGAGKTLYVVSRLQKLLSTGRPLFHNIEGLDLSTFDLPYMQVIDVGEDGPYNWQDFPVGSICIFDEIQYQWPSSMSSRDLPAYIARLDKHRHRGLDFHLITQHPKLLHTGVRRMVGDHFHVNRQFGAKFSIVSKWNSINEDPSPGYTYDDADKEKFFFPRSLFSLYKSAEIHTNSGFYIPRKLIYAFLFLIFLVLLSIYLIYRAIGPDGSFTNFDDSSHQPYVIHSLEPYCLRLVSLIPPTVELNGVLMHVTTGSSTVNYRVVSVRNTYYACWEANHAETENAQRSGSGSL